MSKPAFFSPFWCAAYSLEITSVNFTPAFSPRVLGITSRHSANFCIAYWSNPAHVCNRKHWNLELMSLCFPFQSRCVAQLVSALTSVLEVFSSILSDSNVCSDFSLICVTVALNTRKMEHWQREGVKDAPSATIDNSSMNWRNYRR